MLALQGAFARHVEVLRGLGAWAIEVRTPEQLGRCDALVMPGGESTTMTKLLVLNGLFDPLRARLEAGLPVFGTCAGMILLATDVLDGRPDQRCFAAIDVTVRRNGYGRQIDSFEADLDVDGLDRPFRAVFIRAPVVVCGRPGCRGAGRGPGYAGAVPPGQRARGSFHPELADDDRLHRLFLERVSG